MKNKKTHRRQLIHGLTICKNMKCYKIWNRDENGSSNMYWIAKSVIEGKGRPTSLRRTQNECDITSNARLNPWFVYYL